MNNVCEIGRLTSDVELKMTPSGKSVCSFTIAVYRTKEITDFLPCVAWRQTAERIVRYFRKGNMIGIKGSLQSRKFTDKKGNKRTAIEIVVDEASFCESSKPQEEAGETSAVPPADTDISLEEISGDEDLPF